MPIFPLHVRPKESYKEPPRSFGSSRDHGARKHAGCDLYAPAGTEVLAVEDGTVNIDFGQRLADQAIGALFYALNVRKT